MPLPSALSRPNVVHGAVIIGLLLATGCAKTSREADRADELARTCVSIGERRLADDLDRGDLPSADRFAVALSDVEGRRSGAATLRALCRPQSTVADR